MSIKKLKRDPRTPEQKVSDDAIRELVEASIPFDAFGLQNAALKELIEAQDACESKGTLPKIDIIMNSVCVEEFNFDTWRVQWEADRVALGFTVQEAHDMFLRVRAEAITSQNMLFAFPDAQVFAGGHLIFIVRQIKKQ